MVHGTSQFTAPSALRAVRHRPLTAVQKKKQAEDDAAQAATSKKKKVTPAQLRAQKGTPPSLSTRFSTTSRAYSHIRADLEELSLGTTMKTHFANPDDILNFTLTIDPDEGMYKGGRFNFSFAINQNFPTTRPRSNARRRSTTRTSTSRATCA